MKYVIILVLLADPIYLPFDNTLTCQEQGEEVIETLGVYKEGTDTHTQGWYTKKNKLIYAFYCE
tara:strand:+ start:387 stop:578 length:192 start_codon:yes stop_codon:yes gene_type:complete